MSARVKQLAEREARLQQRCAAQRASIAREVANIEGRFARGAFLRAGITAGSRTFDNCNLLAAGLDATQTAGSQGTETYPDGTRNCHREYPYRPDGKISGTYPLPYGLQLAGTYQFTRGVQNGGAGPSILAAWPVINVVANPQIGRNWTGVASRTIGLIREGLEREGIKVRAVGGE